MPTKTTTPQSQISVKPPLKWAGGKRWLVPYIKPIWAGHSHRRLVEPFCGGFAVALDFQPERVLLNDINPHLVNFFRWLKRGLVADLEMLNDEVLYYTHRARFNELLRRGKEQSKEAAAIFYYLNRTGYNGLCRFNSKGEFNVPFGRYARINYQKDFLGFKSVLRKWEFQCGDFQDLKVASEDFIYADPPYDVEFTKYSKEDFRWDDQKRLAKWLSTYPGPVVLSNQATDRIVDLYEGLGFELEFLDAPRRISCNGDRAPAKEVLALKNL